MATNSSELTNFIDDIDEKVLECSICLKRLKNPKSLYCLHSFCLTCLQDWVKTNGNKLICPTCSTSYTIPKGGLRKLQPNTLLNNLLETIEQFSGRDQIKCICGKIPPKDYCQECEEYLCFACSDHHKDHKPISIVMALKAFRESSIKAEEFAKIFVSGNVQLGLKEFSRNARELGQSKDKCLVDIDNHVREMVKIIKINGEQVKNKVKRNYTKKKAKLDVLMNHLRTEMSDMNNTLSVLNHTSKFEDGTAMKAGTNAIRAVYAAIKNHHNWLSLVKLDNYEQTHFFKNEQQFISLQQCDIGYVSHKMKADSLTLKGYESVNQGQLVAVKVIKTDECEIDTNQLKATWTQSTGETNITPVQHIEYTEDYFVIGKCTSPGICELDVSVVTDNKEIKQSPMKFRVKKDFCSNIYLPSAAAILFSVLLLYMIGLGGQQMSQTIIDSKIEGLVNTIEIAEGSSVFKLFCQVGDVVEGGGDSLLVSLRTSGPIYKYKRSGEYTGAISLPFSVRVNRMYEMKNGNIVFSDLFNRCIRVCNRVGQVVKSIGQGLLNSPEGIEVDEVSNRLYVADEYWFSTSLFIFDVTSGNYIDKIEPQFKFKFTIIERRVTLFNVQNGQLQVVENGRFVTTTKLMCDISHTPKAIVVDTDGNLIILCGNRLDLFRSDGKLIKRINKDKDKLTNPQGLTIISHSPRTVAVANGDCTVKIFNY